MKEQKEKKPVLPHDPKNGMSGNPREFNHETFLTHVKKTLKMS
jgi:hypothetical protein